MTAAAIDVTARQLEIFEFVEIFVAEHGYAPTRQDIATHFGFTSVNAADQHLRALARKGVIRIVPGISRGVVLLAQSAGLPPPQAAGKRPARK